MDERYLIDSFYHNVDMFIRLLGAEQVSRTEVFFRISRAAIGANIDYSELQRIISRISSFSAWYTAWQASADRFAHLAAQAEATGRWVTAGEHYLRAALLYHFAQLFTRPEDSRRGEGQQRRVAYYRLACPYLQPPVEPVQIPLGDLRLPGYLRLPGGHSAPTPVVALIPGASSVKEELHHWGGELVKRGLATLAFDGPGQGELSVRNGGPPLRLENYHEAVGAVLDYLQTRPEVDTQRMALLGQSSGGNLALRAAGWESRLKAVVALSGGYDFRGKSSPTAPIDVREEARDLYGLSSLAQLESYIREHGSLQGIIARIRCPILLLHGGQDRLVALEEVEQIRREAAGPVEMVVYEDGNHSLCNRNLEMSAAMADWLVEQLLPDKPNNIG